jgi:hypothetical protein
MRASIIARIGQGKNVAEICAELRLSYLVVQPIYQEVMNGGWDRVRKPHALAKRAAA